MDSGWNLCQCGAMQLLMTEYLHQNASPALANHLIQLGLLEPGMANLASKEARKRGLPFLNYLVTEKIVNSDAVFEVCKNRFGIPIFNLDEYDPEWLKSINDDLIIRYHVIPLYKQNNTLHIGLSDPTEQHVLDIIMFYTGFKITPMLVAEDLLDRLIKSLQKRIDQDKSIEASLLNQIEHEEALSLIQDHSPETDEPLIKFVDHIIKLAIQQSASDIHIEPYATACRIRYRRDGMLQEANTIPANLTIRLIARLKVMAKLDITERRLPQDGRFQWNNIDIRINTCPTQHGEKVVLRLLDVSKMILDLSLLGLSIAQKETLITKISASQGLILVTGPTGSGKSVTLYSALSYLNTPDKNISTVEDPVEIHLPGINQVSINPKINLSFASILKTLLRQDPDVLMIGEIRDKETAEITLQAAETGHLVLSTLHTNSAIETISRLKSLGISNHDIVSSLTLIISQRLVKALCPLCKEIDHFPYPYLQGLSQPIYRAKGCEHCLSGYRGRTGIYEFLPITANIYELILSGTNNHHIQNEAKNSGYPSLQMAGFEKILNGITSAAEIERVLRR